MLHTGLEAISIHEELRAAAIRILEVLYIHAEIVTTPVNRKTKRAAERNAAIIQLYYEGHSVPDIAKRYGVSKQRVYEILKTERKHQD